MSNSNNIITFEQQEVNNNEKEKCEIWVQTFHVWLLNNETL